MDLHILLPIDGILVALLHSELINQNLAGPVHCGNLSEDCGEIYPGEI
jgi:hypothetical protein